MASQHSRARATRQRKYRIKRRREVREYREQLKAKAANAPKS